MLRESEQKFRILAEQSLIGLLIVQKGKIVYLNEKAAEFYGQDIENIRGLSFQEILKLIHPDDRNRIKKKYEVRLRNKTHFKETYQFKIIDKNKNIKWIESLHKTIPFKGEKAEVIFLVDITEMKRAERRLRESEQKYRSSYNRANFFKNLFIHDINNILQVIMSSNELLTHHIKEKDIDHDIPTFLKMIEKQGKKGVELVQNIHKISELEEKDISFETTNVIRILKESIDFIRKSYKNKDLKINIQSNYSEYFLSANRLLDDVFQNILTNSIKYNNNKVIEIIIKISEILKDDEKYLELKFIDNGMGIKDERKKLIFQKEKEPSEISKGLGIGLSLVKVIIEKYRGQIWVEDRVKGKHEEGSCFIILLPVNK
ncbi:MAG: PAS domain-containing sensor histidine kinase [Promethearchaeota archaeon]|nr:MAG: PAS domain-containing sensor histidine kinase [Candidatus Lokiarchaeota archaeon]